MKPYRDDKAMLCAHLSGLRHERGVTAHNGREGVGGQPASYPHRQRLRRLDLLISRYEVRSQALEPRPPERWDNS